VAAALHGTAFWACAVGLVPRHEVKFDCIWLTRLFDAFMKFWVVAWICEVWFATCCWIWASVKK